MSPIGCVGAKGATVQLDSVRANGPLAVKLRGARQSAASSASKRVATC